MSDKKKLDYDSLDPEQQAIADKVYFRAKKYGLNPDFVLPLVYAESGFRHVQQTNGPAFGVMQLEPDVAKSMKCDPTDLDENIDCGMRLIKSHVDNPRIGNDPYKNIIAYNTRSDTLKKFLDSYDTDPEHPEKHIDLLPEQTQNHIRNIMKFHGGELPSAIFEKPQQDQEESSAEPAPSVADYSNEGYGKVRPKPTERPINPIAGGILGATAGASLAHPIAQYKTYYDLAKSAMGMVPRDIPNVKVEPSMGVEPVEGSISAGEPILGEPNLSEPTPSKPVGGKGVYNYAKSFGADELEAKNATGMTKAEIWADMQRAKAAKAKIAQIAPEMKFDPSLGEHGLYTPQSGGAGPRGGPRSTPVQSETKVVSEPVTNAVTEEVANLGSRSATPIRSALGQVFKNMMIPIQGAAAGFGAGFGGLDAYNRYRSGDTTGSTASGIGALASLLSPFVEHAGGLSMAIPAGLAIRDVYKNSYLPVSSKEEQARLAREYPDNSGNPLAQP